LNLLHTWLKEMGTCLELFAQPFLDSSVDRMNQPLEAQIPLLMVKGSGSDVLSFRCLMWY